MRRIILLAAVCFLGVSSLYAQTGEIKGRVTDENGDGVPFANVIAYQNGVLISGTSTDFDGNYILSSLSPGNYDITASSLGIATMTQTGVNVSANKTTQLNFAARKKETLLDSIVIKWKRPMVEKEISVNTIGSEEIAAKPFTDIGNLVSTNAGVYQSDNGGDLHFLGGRGDANEVYIDNIRVIGSFNVPVNSIQEMSTYTAGIPAKFGDATGGIIDIITRGPSRNFGGNVDLATSQGMDAYGFNRIAVDFTGPLVIKNKGEKDERVLLGYFVAGEYQRFQDANPSAVGVYKAKDDVLEFLEKNPLVPSPVSEAFIVTTETVTLEDLESVRTKPNVAENRYSVSGKLELKPSRTITIAAGGNYIYTRRHDWVDRYTMFNHVNNPLYNENTWRVYGRFRQRFDKEQSPTGSDEYDANGNTTPVKGKATIQNASYQVQFDYTKVYDKFSDDSHGFRPFDYGYIGNYDIHRRPIYDFGRDDVSGKTGWKLLGYQDTLVRFAPGTVNPTGTAFTDRYYELAGAIFQNGFWSTPASGDQDGFYQTLNQVQVNGGLLNGDRPRVPHDIWFNTGRQFNGYGVQRDNEQFRMSVLGSFDIVPAGTGNKHGIEFGFEFEQRIERNYQVGSIGLWELMRQLANKHIDQLDTDNPYLWIDGQRYSYNDPNAPDFGQNDTILYDRKYVAEQQSFFDKSLRRKLGLADNNTDLINTDGLTPDFYALDMFSADELLNNGSNYVFYTGYDFLGNRLTTQPTFDDFFKKKDANGNYTREIGAFRPIYSSVFIQDKFNFRDLLFNIGLRVDRFDANQKVLRDPFTLYQALTVDEAAGRLDGTVPTNIGGDYVVYVDDFNKANPVPIGYRDGTRWYTAEGVEINNARIIASSSASGRITPFLANPNDNIKSEDFVPSNSFKDYDPQITLMPRIAFAFNITETANFFAHYNILTQRPQSRIFTTPDTWYFFNENVNTTVNNPALKPERTIDYQIGFKQAINEDMAFTLTAYYREMRDMIQVINMAYAYPRDYRTFGNVDFGTVKGFSIAYEMRKTNTSNLSLSANYTIQFAEGTGSNTTSQLNLVGAGQPNLRTINPLSFDSRHNVNVSIDYSYGSGRDYNGPVSKKGKQILSNAGVNLIARTRSGEPYTKQQNPTADALNAQASRKILTGSINGSRLPWNFRVDLRVWKDFNLNRERKDAEGNVLKNNRDLRMNVYLLVQNLLNTANVLGVYPYTGNADDDGYLASDIGQQDLNSRINAQSYNDLYWAFAQSGLDPTGARGSLFSQPRNVRIGAIFKF